jgi:hypothetical protein
MSALITSALVTPCGSITNAAAGGYVDAAGNVFGSPGFLPNYVIDYAGNLGTIPVANNCSFIATIIGSAIEPGPWEMAIGGTTAGETIGAHLGTIAQNYVAGTTAATALTNFTSANTIGYMAGNISGNGTFTIQNGPQSIGGTTYGGNGLTIFTGVNTAGGILNMEPGTKIQFGEDCSNATTKWAGGLTIGQGATATQYTSFAANTYLCQALTNAGTYNVIGCGECGSGFGLAAAVANNGTINIDGAVWANRNVWTGTGTVNVKDGGTFQLTSYVIPSTTRVNINGCGWCDSTGTQIGAIQVAGNGVTHSMRIHVETAACIKSNTNNNNTFAGLLTGSAPLTIGSLAATKPNGIVHFSNTANSYFGTMTVDGTTINASYGNSLQYAKIVLANGGRIGTNANSGQVIGSLASTDSTTYWQSGDPSNNTIAKNGVTSYAGRLLWTGGLYAANYFLNGPSSNQLTMTSTGNTGNIYPRNGSKLILQGATFTAPGGQVRVQTGATVSAGTSTTASCTYLSIDAASGLDVFASGATTGKIGAGAVGLVLSAGWKVNLKEPLPAGTHVIMTNAGAAVTVLPTIGENLSGRTVTGFAWNNAVNPKTLSVTLA